MSYQLQIELRNAETGAGYTWSFQPDWAPAIEHTRFAAMRRSLLPPDAQVKAVIIAPLWSGLGAPYASGFRLLLRTDQGEFAHEFAREYFGSLATILRSSIPEKEKIGTGASFPWHLIAWPNGDPWTVPGTNWDRACCQTVRIREGDLRALLRSSRAEGTIHEDDLPVFVPESVCEEVAAASKQAVPMEIGGVMIGYLCRDSQSKELYALITAQVPALGAVGSEGEVRFTPDAWAEVRAAITLRRREEMWLAWNHSHPSPCKTCAPEKQETCPMAIAFFSPQDRKLHRTVFSQAHQFALVANVLRQRVVFSMFGWREGCICRRGFYICNGETHE
jgi:hypothetical protein